MKSAIASVAAAAAARFARSADLPFAHVPEVGLVPARSGVARVGGLDRGELLALPRGDVRARRGADEEEHGEQESHAPRVRSSPRIARCVVAAALLAGAFAGCTDESASGPDPDLGPIEATLTPADRVNWPGVDHAGSRELLYTQAFAEGRPGGYWFLGFGQRRTADSFWFCRQGDTACPLDEHHRLNWDRIVGRPLFMRIPGQDGFSPFWQMWVVRVPDSYEANSIKTIASLHRRTETGELEASALITDFGTTQGDVVGPRETILHCALTLDNTTLSRNGTTMSDGTDRPMMEMQIKPGWHEGRTVHFVDFSTAEGVFPAADDSESRPLMPIANVYVLWRWCDLPAGSPRPAICDLPGSNPRRRSVSERGAGQDFTHNRNTDDTNNTFAALVCERQRPGEFRYSPLWKINFVLETPGAGVNLVDSSEDPMISDVQSANDVFARVEAGDFEQPVPQREDEFGNPLPGNDGLIFFNCPFSRPEGTVPWPCE